MTGPERITPTTVFVWQNISSWGGTYSRWDWAEPAAMAQFMRDECLPDILSGQLGLEEGEPAPDDSEESPVQEEFDALLSDLAKLPAKSAKAISRTLSRVVPAAGGLLTSLGEPDVTLEFYSSPMTAGQALLEMKGTETIGEHLVEAGLLPSEDAENEARVAKEWRKVLARVCEAGNSRSSVKARMLLFRAFEASCEEAG